MPAVRRPGVASAAALAGITLTVAAVQLVAPGWTRAAGLDVWNLAADQAQLAATLTEGEAMDARNQRTLEQIRASDGVAGRLGAGALTLAAAVDELEALNADRPGWDDALWASQPDVPTRRLRVARYAILKLADRCRADPSAWAVLSARLEAEYRALGG